MSTARCTLRPRKTFETLNSALRTDGCQSARRRCFATSTHLQTSPLLNLSGLSNSRESQHLAKEHRVPRTEYSSQLQLIRSSEVDPFDAPGSSPFAPQRQRQHGAHVAAKVSPQFVPVLEELAATKREIRELTAVLASLNARYLNRDRDARRLSWVVVLLVLGIALPQVVNVNDPLHKLVDRAWLADRKDRNPSLQPVQDRGSGRQERIEIPPAVAKRISIPSEPPSHTITANTSSSLLPWSRMFWSSPS